MRVEIFDSNNNIVNEIVDPETKMIINSHMSILDFFITIAKAIKKQVKNYTQAEVETIKCWNTLAFAMVMILQNLNVEKETQNLREKILSNDQTDAINLLINYINMLNNINIVLADKSISTYIIYQFVKYGGVEKIFNICRFVLTFCEILNEENSNSGTFIDCTFAY